MIKVIYESSNIWTFEVRYMNYIFGSVGNVSFFFNTDEKNNNNTFITSDYIKIVKKQYESGNNSHKIFIGNLVILLNILMDILIQKDLMFMDMMMTKIQLLIIQNNLI